jgi:hypothetical protein
MKNLFAAICFITFTFAVHVPPLGSAGKDTMCFYTRDSGLSWPTTNGRDIHQLVGHGPHCLEMLEMYKENQPQNDMDRMHEEHCDALITNVVHFFKANPSYFVPSMICDDIKGLYTSELGEIYGYLNYNYDNLNMTEDSAVFQHFSEEAANQNDLFALISGQNLGNLLLRQWKKEQLTPTEHNYLQDWDTKIYAHRNVRLAAFGIYCIHGQNMFPHFNNLYPHS